MIRCVFSNIWSYLLRSPGPTAGPEFQDPHLSHEGPGLTILEQPSNLHIYIIWYKNFILCHAEYLALVFKMYIFMDTE